MAPDRTVEQRGAPVTDSRTQPSRGRRAQAWLLAVPLALIVLGLTVSSLVLAEAYLGRAGRIALIAALVAAPTIGRPIPGLGRIRAATRRLRSLPIFSRPGLELWWLVQLVLWSVGLATAIPGHLRGALGADVVRVEDLAHGWKASCIGWAPERHELIGVHADGADYLGFTIVDVSGTPPVSRFFSAPWDNAVLDLTMLGTHGLAVAHTEHDDRSFLIDLDRRTATTRPEVGVIASAFDPVNDRIHVIQRGRRTVVSGGDTRVLTLDLDDYLAERWSEAQHHEITTPSAPTALATDPHDPNHLYVRGEGSTRGIAEIDLVRGETRALDLPPPLGGLAIDAQRRRAYVTNGARSSLYEISLDGFELEREVWLGGVPGTLDVLTGTGAIAVGTRMTGELLVLDQDTLEVYVRLKTCWRKDPAFRTGAALFLGEMREFAWDEPSRTLFVADVCGLRRVRFPPGWRVHGAEPAADSRAGEPT